MPTSEQLMTSKVIEIQNQKRADNAQQNVLDQQNQVQKDITNQISEQQELQQEQAQPFIDQAQLAQEAQLGLLGQEGGNTAAARNLMNSPLIQAINRQNQQNINAQAASSGVSGGNLLKALQDANTSTILNAGFGGLGQIAGQSGGLGLGFNNAAMNMFNSGTNQQQNVLQSNIANTLYKAQQANSGGNQFVQGVNQQQQDLSSLIGLIGSFAKLGGGGGDDGGQNAGGAASSQNSGTLF